MAVTPPRPSRLRGSRAGDDAGALVDERLGRRQPDALPCSGYDCHLVGEFEVHRGSLRVGGIGLEQLRIVRALA
jgi:hypothetical protein